MERIQEYLAKKFVRSPDADRNGRTMQQFIDFHMESDWFCDAYHEGRLGEVEDKATHEFEF